MILVLKGREGAVEFVVTVTFITAGHGARVHMPCTSTRLWSINNIIVSPLNCLK